MKREKEESRKGRKSRERAVSPHSVISVWRSGRNVQADHAQLEVVRRRWRRTRSPHDALVVAEPILLHLRSDAPTPCLAAKALQTLTCNRETTRCNRPYLTGSTGRLFWASSIGFAVEANLSLITNHGGRMLMAESVHVS